MTEKTWRLKRTVQCAKCPWRKDVDPFDIPNGYDVEKHKALAKTIARPGEFRTGGEVMACHETEDAHCIGWLVNQAGIGNNIGLRLHLMTCENAREIKIIGEQHERFEDTLPKEKRCSSRSLTSKAKSSTRSAAKGAASPSSPSTTSKASGASRSTTTRRATRRK